MELPAALKISGGAASSAMELRGHGLWLSSDDLAASASSLVGAPYMADHDGSIKSVAGYVTEASAKRHFIEVPLMRLKDESDPWSEMEPTGEVKREKAATVRYSASLSSKHEGYASVAQHILATKEDGMIPHVSVTILGERLDYEPSTNRLILAGKMQMVELSSVYQGAATPEVDVGVFDVEPIELSLSAADGVTQTRTVPAQLHLKNAPDLFIAFAEKNGYDSPLSLRVALALGIDKPASTKPRASSIPLTPALKQASKEDTIMTDEPPIPAPPAPIPAALPPEVMARLSKLDELDGLKADVLALRTERDEARKLALVARRETIQANHPHVSASLLSALSTIESLNDLEASLALSRGGNPLPRKLSKVETDKVADDEKERQEALKVMAAAGTNFRSGGRS